MRITKYQARDLKSQAVAVTAARTSTAKSLGVPQTHSCPFRSQSIALSRGCPDGVSGSVRVRRKLSHSLLVLTEIARCAKRAVRRNYRSHSGGEMTMRRCALCDRVAHTRPGVCSASSRASCPYLGRSAAGRAVPIQVAVQATFVTAAADTKIRPVQCGVCLRACAASNLT